MRFDDPAHLRRIILWVMLGALGVSAALAVLGVMTTNFSEEYQMIGTGITAAVASGLLLASCKLLDSEKSRKTGLLLMGIIVFEFVLVLLALWNPLRPFSQWRGQESLGMTALIFPVAALPAALFFHIRQFRGGKLTAYIGMTLCALSFFAFLAATWYMFATPNSWLQDGELWGVAWTCWLFAIVGSATTAGFGLNHWNWRWIGSGAAAIAFGMSLYSIWLNLNSPTDILIIASTVAVLTAHVNVMWLCKLKPRQQWLRVATTLFAFLAGAALDYAALEQSGSLDLTWRLGMAAGICSGCGTVAVAILTVFNRRSSPLPIGSGNDLTQIPIACPCCNHKLFVALKDGIGETSCPGCGMIYNIRVRAPRCPGCNYILLMFQGTRCPECGTAVSPSLGPVLA